MEANRISRKSIRERNRSINPTLRHFLKSLRLRLPEMGMDWGFCLSLAVKGSPCLALLCSEIAALLLFCTTLNAGILNYRPQIKQNPS